MSTATETWASRYARAQAVLAATDAVANGAVFPHWIDARRFWYKRRGPSGVEYRLVDAPSGDNRPLVDQAEVTQALSSRLGRALDADRLLLRNVRVDAASGQATFTAFGEAYVWRTAERTLAPAATEQCPKLVSPNGRHGAFLRDHNLWLRDRETGKERPLTLDGADDNAYGEPPAVRRRLAATSSIASPPEAQWSPDSTYLFTVQVDERHVPEFPSVELAPLEGVRPRISTTRISLPGDPRVSEFRLLAIDVETGAQIEARYPRLSAVRMNDTPFSAGLTWWSTDSRSAYFVAIERGERLANVVAFDIETGATRIVLSESSATYLDLGPNVYERALLRALPETHELIWYSERSGHGHLYLYDLDSGEYRGAITSGSWQVRDVLHVDEERRDVLVMVGGLDPNADPYLVKPCLASLDGGPVTVVSEEPGEHVVWKPGAWALSLLDLAGEDRHDVSGVSPDGSFFVETVGGVDRLPRTVLRRRGGELVAVVEVAASRGLPEDWVWPEPVRLTAADGATATYGLLFKPAANDPGGAYPLIDLIYGGPQLSHVPKSAFAHGGFGTDQQLLEAAHLASLGAYVLLLDGRGTAGRERGFREVSYGAIHTASSVDDHVAGIQELAAREPAIDLERVAVCGFSGGGYAAALAILRRGDFFKVAVAGGGNYDQRLFWHTWGERYHGVFEPAHYLEQAASSYARGLSGKLLLIHGLLDAACPPAAMVQLVQALIEAGKDVDVVLEPREGHRLGGYGLRRRLDYLVTHLFDTSPPVDVDFANPLDELTAR